jgi:hypothetical protein
MFCALRQTRNGCKGATGGCALQQRPRFVTQNLSCVKMQVFVVSDPERACARGLAVALRWRLRAIPRRGGENPGARLLLQIFVPAPEEIFRKLLNFGEMQVF